MIKKGIPLKRERGDCPGMDEAGHPEGYWIRVGKGLPPFAYEQDCSIYDAEKDRIQVVNVMTNVGVEVPAIKLIGDGNGRTGGAYLLRPLDNPVTWASGQGIRRTLVFSPQSPIQEDWYINAELRGTLSFTAKNEGSAVLTFAIRNDKFKCLYYVDAVDGDGGGSRFVQEFKFPFKQHDWYELVTELIPDHTKPNTWNIALSMRKLTPKGNSPRVVVWGPEPILRPNRVETIDFAGWGDEQQGLDSGGEWLVSVDEDERIDTELI
jgi:hypothetical protein